MDTALVDQADWKLILGPTCEITKHRLSVTDLSRVSGCILPTACVRYRKDNSAAQLVASEEEYVYLCKREVCSKTSPRRADHGKLATVVIRDTKALLQQSDSQA